LTEAEVALVVGAPSAALVNGFLESLAAKDIAKAFGVFHDALSAGVEPRVFVLLALAKVRGVLLLRFAPEMRKELAGQFAEADLAVLERLAGKEGVAINSSLLAELLTALLETQRAPMPQLPLELALYRVFGQSLHTK
jgi:DNA polymerase III gamma/tau subunit